MLKLRFQIKGSIVNSLRSIPATTYPDYIVTRCRNMGSVPARESSICDHSTIAAYGQHSADQIQPSTEGHGHAYGARQASWRAP